MKILSESTHTVNHLVIVAESEDPELLNLIATKGWYFGVKFPVATQQTFFIRTYRFR